MLTSKLLEIGVRQHVGGDGQVALCWAIAKDTSMQGGSHGDRCVQQSSWRQVCEAVKEHMGGHREGREGGGGCVLLTVAAGVVLQFVRVF